MYDNFVRINNAYVETILSSIIIFSHSSSFLFFFCKVFAKSRSMPCEKPSLQNMWKYGKILKECAWHKEEKIFQMAMWY